MVDYSAYDDIVARKKKEQRYLTLEDGECAVFTFLGIKLAIRENPFSGEEEEVWLIDLEDSEGYRKRWTVASLYIFNQFKEQNIQEGDRIRITKKRRKKIRYLVEKIEMAKIKKVAELEGEKIPVIEEEEEEDEQDREKSLPATKKRGVSHRKASPNKISESGLL